MKMILVLILLGVGGYFGYQHYQAQRDAAPVITDPVWVEIRLEWSGEGRDIELALFGKMINDQDCRELARSSWKAAIDCKECQVQTLECRAELEPRYARLFDNVPIHSTYMTFASGARDEREGRMVIYGLTADEGDEWCGLWRQEVMRRGYKGAVGCVNALRD